ncbi:hypothetical protein RHMOL_Rhmol04G0128400 [Rhododendron molle]|uniref:Uncharacterized protein n=1 Tax=Rhododendron molle TaxID=49168 RepID=A0ACC0P294_RHOML|nr:hypothetical protein RHMOL_Rhmol04G0128400 [Rhododendron molle]
MCSVCCASNICLLNKYLLLHCIKLCVSDIVDEGGKLVPFHATFMCSDNYAIETPVHIIDAGLIVLSNPMVAKPTSSNLKQILKRLAEILEKARREEKPERAESGGEGATTWLSDRRWKPLETNQNSFSNLLGICGKWFGMSRSLTKLKAFGGECARTAWRQRKISPNVSVPHPALLLSVIPSWKLLNTSCFSALGQERFGLAAIFKSLTNLDIHAQPSNGPQKFVNPYQL